MEFDRDYDPRYGELVTLAPGLRRMVANNPGPFTFYGTGTYVVGQGRVAVIDPGPDLPAHVEALQRALVGERISHILVTHTHLDHSPAAKYLKASAAVPTYGFGPHGGESGEVEAGADRDFQPDVVLGDGDWIEGEGWRLQALHTPGHTSNHLCFAWPEGDALFCGDHVMAWSTTVIAPPDGDMRAYMASLETLAARPERTFWPTHGNPIRDPRGFIAALAAHRRERRAKVLAALTPEPQSPRRMVGPVYGAELDPRLVGAAAQSLLAHLIELREEGLAVATEAGWRLA